MCLSRKGEYPSAEAVQGAMDGILTLLADGKPHHVTEVNTLNLPNDAADEALCLLLDEERIYQRDGFLYI